MSRRAVWALLAALGSASCAQPLMKLPAGPGAVAPAAEADAAFAQATDRCRAVTTFTAEIAASGSVGGRRVRARLFAGLAAPASARLEAVAAFGPVFVFAAQGDDATLLLPHDGRVLEHGPPAAILEALTGLPLDPAELRSALIGCAAGGGTRTARQLGEDWILLQDGKVDVYVHRSPHAAPWRLVAAVHHGESAGEWRAQYENFQDGMPQTVRLTSVASNRFDLQLALSQVEINGPLDAEAFRVRVPPTASSMTLSELRDVGPLSDPAANGR